MVKTDSSCSYKTHLAAGQQIRINLRNTSNQKNIGITNNTWRYLSAANCFNLTDGRKALCHKWNIGICNYLHLIILSLYGFLD